MAGNVAEWCAEFDDQAETWPVVCGGSRSDTEPLQFDVTRHRNEEQNAHRRWIGFRGVVRVGLDK